VIGGGQAGLGIGYYLKQQGRHFVILDANERIGDSWRKRWDSLRLFTPARFDGFPGMHFPSPGHTPPGQLYRANDNAPKRVDPFPYPSRGFEVVASLSRNLTLKW
jgi:cation diffusion facilitator CzcD-associated flavoprotein CzcO